MSINFFSHLIIISDVSDSKQSVSSHSVSRRRYAVL